MSERDDPQADLSAADEMVAWLLKQAKDCPPLPIGESAEERERWTRWVHTALMYLGAFEFYRHCGPIMSIEDRNGADDEIEDEPYCTCGNDDPIGEGWVAGVCFSCGRPLLP